VNPNLTTDRIPYPTPHLQGLFARLCRELERMRQLLGKRAIQVTVPMRGMTHARMLRTVHVMFDTADPALSLFLKYPTLRLALVLTQGAAEASTAVARLAQNPPSDSESPHLAQEYAACCERIQSGIADWRLSVDLKRAEYDLDLGPVETVH
jgi:hypothetical protein